MPDPELLRQLETTVRALRMAVAGDDFEAAANLSDSLRHEFERAWQLCPAEREAFLQTTLDGVRGSLVVSVERREAIRHQVDLMDACEDASATTSTRRTPLSVSF